MPGLWHFAACFSFLQELAPSSIYKITCLQKSIKIQTFSLLNALDDIIVAAFIFYIVYGGKIYWTNQQACKCILYIFITRAILQVPPTAPSTELLQYLYK